MSSIKDLLSEEKNAEQLVKNAERQAEDIVSQARIKAREILKKAETDDTRVKELTQLCQSRISALKSKVMEECQAQEADTEELLRGNFDGAIKLIVDSVLSMKNIEQRSGT